MIMTPKVVVSRETMLFWWSMSGRTEKYAIKRIVSTIMIGVNKAMMLLRVVAKYMVAAVPKATPKNDKTMWFL